MQDAKFLSTPSARRATYDPARREIVVEFLSTPSARRATSWSLLCRLMVKISIHALREEGDGVPVVIDMFDSGISIHALREEGDRDGPQP